MYCDLWGNCCVVKNYCCVVKVSVVLWKMLLCCEKFLLCCEIFCVEVWQIHATVVMALIDHPWRLHAGTC